MVDKITILCFAASYAVALLLEILRLSRPRNWQRVLAALFGGAGLLAHTLFLGAQRPALTSQFGLLLFLAWVLAIFYLYGSIHHRKVAWGVFVLPVVLGLVGLAAYSRLVAMPSTPIEPSAETDRLWRLLHVALFVLASVGLCVAFVASIMYLVQARRLRAKTLSGPGLRLLSLERLEGMNSRAINLSFTLLTVGMLVSAARMLGEGSRPAAGWTDPRVLSTVALWLMSMLVLYLRYGFHLRGRKMALLTIMAFGFLLVSLVTSHGGAP